MFLGHLVTVVLEIAILFSKVAALLYNSMKFPVFLHPYQKMLFRVPLVFTVLVHVKVVLCYCDDSLCPAS